MIARADLFGAAPLCWPIDVPAKLHVCHIMTADLWAGAEVQLATTVGYLVNRPEILPSVVLLNEGRLARELRDLGVEVVVIDERCHTAVGILRFLTRFLKARRIDIVHTHRYKDTVLGAAAAKLAGVRHVVRTMHGLPEPMGGWDRVKFRAYNALDKTALWCIADRIIAVSNGMAETLRRTGYRGSSIITIHNGVDLTKIRMTRESAEIRRDLDIPLDALFIGTVGRMSPVKAHKVFLHAAQRILRTNHSARFAIVGDGPLKGELDQLATQLGVRHAFRLPGPRPDIHDVVGAMDIFVLPSLHEGIPMALLEAMALSKPVVASAVGGIPEVVTNQVDGVLVPPRDDEALASACLSVARDPERGRAMGATACLTVAERFSSQRSGEALMGTYSTVMAPTAPKRTTAADLSALALAWELVSGLVRAAAQRAFHAFQASIEKRRMNRVRRAPARLHARLRASNTVLVVCQGNIIRSAFAARLMTETVGVDRKVRIVSGGLAAVAGTPAHPTAFQLAMTRAIDLSQHAASPLAPQTVAESDVIFVMDIAQLIAVRRRFPQARSKTFLLTSLAPSAPLEIRDPFDGDESRFQACFDHITRAVGPIVASLRGTPVFS